MKPTLQETTLKLQIIQAIMRQSQDHSELAQRHYNVALNITGLSVLLSISIFIGTASGKFSDKAINSLIGILPLTCCVQLISSAGKQLTASSQQLNELLDDF